MGIYPNRKDQTVDENRVREIVREELLKARHSVQQCKSPDGPEQTTDEKRRARERMTRQFVEAYNAMLVRAEAEPEQERDWVVKWHAKVSGTQPDVYAWLPENLAQGWDKENATTDIREAHRFTKEEAVAYACCRRFFDQYHSPAVILCLKDRLDGPFTYHSPVNRGDIKNPGVYPKHSDTPNRYRVMREPKMVVGERATISRGLTICRVHPNMYPCGPAAPTGQTLEELRADLMRMLEALEQPIIE